MIQTEFQGTDKKEWTEKQDAKNVPPGVASPEEQQQPL